MDSLALYRDIYQNSRTLYGNEKYFKIEELVQSIYSEITVEPYNISNSTFLVASTNLLHFIKRIESFSLNQIDVYPYDARIIIKILLDKLENNTYSFTSDEYTEYRKLLFNDIQFRGDKQTELIEIRKLLTRIQVFLETKKTKEKPIKAEDLHVKKYKIVDNRPQPIKQETDDTKSKVDRLNTIDNVSQVSEPNVNNEKSVNVRDNRQHNIQDWHKHTGEIQSQLNEIQPLVSQALQGIMSFSNNITENYVLQFAKMQINLYNLICDNLTYHLSASKDSGNQDYINAVSNYIEFLDEIMDNLSAFGVEEITSNVGDKFDGRIHEVIENTEFSPKTSYVSESVRTGFKYKELIIQKEKIRI